MCGPSLGNWWAMVALPWGLCGLSFPMIPLRPGSSWHYGDLDRAHQWERSIPQSTNVSRNNPRFPGPKGGGWYPDDCPNPNPGVPDPPALRQE